MTSSQAGPTKKRVPPSKRKTSKKPDGNPPEPTPTEDSPMNDATPLDVVDQTTPNSRRTRASERLKVSKPAVLSVIPEEGNSSETQQASTRRSVDPGEPNGVFTFLHNGWKED